MMFGMLRFTIQLLVPYYTMLKNPLFFITLLLAAWLLFMAGYTLGQRQSVQNSVVPEPGDDAVICTMDAMICPDGTAVGRTGPNCEFSPCPVNLPGMEK